MSSSRPRFSFRLLLGAGRVLRELGLSRAARRVFRVAHRVAPGEPLALFYEGTCQERLGQRDAARASFVAASLCPQRSATAAVRLGHALRRRGEPYHAGEVFAAADALRPDHAETLFHRGLCAEDGEEPLAAQSFYERALALRPGDTTIERHLLAVEPRLRDVPDRLHFVILGTIGACNASCIHCPTGKAVTRHVPRAPMPMDLYRKIIDGIAEAGLPVVRQIAFGLFGDALLDPYILERARYLRERLPSAVLSINTNAAAYDPAKHAALNETASIVAIHCESLVPAVFDDLMRPLRAARVYPKYEAIFRDFPRKVQVAVPLHRRNVAERASMRAHFEALGATHIDFAPLANRCATDDTLFERLAFDPKPIRCEPGIFYNLIVDCDGAVLACCNDFARETPLGSLREASVEAILVHADRVAMRATLAAGRHDRVETCRRCRGDVAAPACVPAEVAT